MYAIQADGDGAIVARFATSAEAMAAFAARGFAGRILDEDAPATPVAVAPVATIGGARSQAVAAAEQEAQRMVVQAAIGVDVFAAAPTWFAHGTPLIEIGRDKYHASVQTWESLPPIEDAIHAVAERITSEHRKDVVADVAELRLDERGRITRNGTDFVALESPAFDAIVSRYASVFPRGRALLHAVDADVRADVFNRQVCKLAALPENERGIRLRLRRVGGIAQCFAAVSPSYTVRDGDAWLTHDVLPVIEGQGWRGNAIYDAAGVNTSFRAEWHAPESFGPTVGDVFRVAIGGRTNDTGSGSFRSWGGFVRAICVNLTIADLTAELKRHVHRGSVDTISQQIRDTLSAARDGFAPFGTAWGILKETPIATALTSLDVDIEEGATGPAAWFDALASHTALVDTGIARDVLVEALLSGYAAEPGETAEALVNAVTRLYTSRALDVYQAERAAIAGGALVAILAGGGEA